MRTDRFRSLPSRGREVMNSATLGAVARKVRREGLTYLSTAKLRSLEGALRRVQSEDVPGDVLECGIALGGSGIVLASAMDPDRTFHGFDVFGMIPAPGERDGEDAHRRFETIRSGESKGIGGATYYGYVDDLEREVADNFARHGVPVSPGRVELHRGLFEDTLNLERPVALAHIDSDWYEPVALCLERIFPHLSPGGMIILDDYRDYRGCARASHEFLAEHEDARIERGDPHLVIRRPVAVAA